MGIGPTISSGWRLSTLSSLVVGTVLLFFLMTSRENAGTLSPRSFAMSVVPSINLFPSIPGQLSDLSGSDTGGRQVDVSSSDTGSRQTDLSGSSDGSNTGSRQSRQVDVSSFHTGSRQMDLSGSNNGSDTGSRQVDVSSSDSGSRQSCSNNGSDTGSRQVDISSSDTGSRQADLSSSDTGSQQVDVSGSNNGSRQADLSGSDTGSRQAELSGSDAGSRQVDRKEEHKCDIFDGKWVYDPETSPVYQGAQCPFLSDQVSCQKNGRPDSYYERWNWVGNGCDIPRFNGTDMLERLRGKRVIVVGDSLNRNQWESLACLLYSSISPSDAYVNVQSGMYKVFKAKNYNCVVEFYWSPFLVPLETDKVNGKKILILDRLDAAAKNWKGANIMIFNTGHWWVHRGKFKVWNYFRHKGELIEDMETERAFARAMKSWARWTDKNVDPTQTTVFFRSISPEHQGNQWCLNITRPLTDDSYKQTFPMTIRKITEKTMRRMRTPVRHLNITKLSEYRRDGHPTVYTSKGGKLLTAKQRKRPDIYGDCSHWCIPGVPDTWNRLLYASLVLGGDSGGYRS